MIILPKRSLTESRQSNGKWKIKKHQKDAAQKLILKPHGVPFSVPPPFLVDLFVSHVQQWLLSAVHMYVCSVLQYHRWALCMNACRVGFYCSSLTDCCGRLGAWYLIIWVGGYVLLWLALKVPEHIKMYLYLSISLYPWQPRHMKELLSHQSQGTP